MWYPFSAYNSNAVFLNHCFLTASVCVKLPLHQMYIAHHTFHVSSVEFLLQRWILPLDRMCASELLSLYLLWRLCLILSLLYLHCPLIEVVPKNSSPGFSIQPKQKRKQLKNRDFEKSILSSHFPQWFLIYTFFKKIRAFRVLQSYVIPNQSYIINFLFLQSFSG